jgi:hypothetical protein
MLNAVDEAIINWTRGQILADLEAVDLVPPGPWTVDLTEPALTGNGTPPAQTGFPQIINPGTLPGIKPEAIMCVYDPEGTPPVTAPYVVAVADPGTVRTRLSAELAKLGLCHSYLGNAETEPPAILRQMIRLMAAGYAGRDGYQARAWAPENFQVPAPAAATASS